MNEAVDRVLLDRERVDQGYSRGLGISAGVHGVILVVGIAVPLIFPAGPQLQVADAFAVALPPMGRGNPSAPETAPAPAQPAPQQPPVTTPAAPEPPPKIIKPPKEEPRQGLPEPDAKPAKREKERRSAAFAPAATSPTAIASETKGLALAATTGAGVPGGMDPNGDYYLASVQRKIWSIWNQQLRGGMQPPVALSLTIMADGTVTDVQIVQSSGIYTVDAAAQRAILTAAPFAPLPKSYGTNAFTIRAVFKPEG